MKFIAPTKLRPGLAALAAAALLSLPASAQLPPPDESEATENPADEPEESSAPEETDAPEAQPEPEAAPEEPPEPEASDEPKKATRPAPTDAPEKSAEPVDPESYVGFAPPAEPARIENSTMTLQLGLIAQPQYEVVGAPDAEKTSKNLFLRRAGLIVHGTVHEYFEYFFDVDYPNLFKVDPSNQAGGTGKNAPGLNVQDVIVTFAPVGNLIKFDAGFMLPALNHNAIQGAATLYSWDYFVNSFRRNVLSSLDPFKSTGQSPAGRDAGFQLRGLLFGEHLEYRVGLFQGLRVGPLPASQGTDAEVGGVNFFRVASRLQINILDAEPGYFYQGTYLGTKKILSVGGFYDFQDEYKALGGDLILDLPAGPGIITLQANYVQWDGGNFIQTLPKQTAIMAEAGYLIRPLMLSPIGRFERLIASEQTAQSPSEDRFSGGLAFWAFGHNSNLKAFYTLVHRVPAPQDYYQVNVQWQLFF